MGTEALWIPAVISAVGAGVSAGNTYRTAKKQDRAAADGIARQAERQREADARLNAEIGAMERSTPEDEQAASLNSFMQQLQASRAQARGAGDVPGGSNRYQTDSKATDAAIGNYGDKVASILSRIRAPLDQRRGEGQAYARAGNDVDVISRNAAADDFLSQLRTRSIQRNPWADAFAQTAQGVAQGMATRGPKAPPKMSGPPAAPPGYFNPNVWS